MIHASEVRVPVRMLGLAFLLGLGALSRAEESVDLEMITRIRDEGFHYSQVMKTAAELTDVIGPRLTIMAAFVWNAANREALLPRKPFLGDP